MSSLMSIPSPFPRYITSLLQPMIPRASTPCIHHIAAVTPSDHPAQVPNYVSPTHPESSAPALTDPAPSAPAPPAPHPHSPAQAPALAPNPAPAAHGMRTRTKPGICVGPRPILDRNTTTSSSIRPYQKPTAVPKRDPHWLSAMTKEFNALSSNHTWDLVPRPLNANVVSSKWVYHHKFKVLVLFLPNPTHLSSYTNMVQPWPTFFFMSMILLPHHLPRRAIISFPPYVLNSQWLTWVISISFFGISVTRSPSGLFLSQENTLVKFLNVLAWNIASQVPLLLTHAPNSPRTGILSLILLSTIVSPVPCHVVKVDNFRIKFWI